MNGNRRYTCAVIDFVQNGNDSEVSDISDGSDSDGDENENLEQYK